MLLRTWLNEEKGVQLSTSPVRLPRVLSLITQFIVSPSQSGWGVVAFWCSLIRIYILIHAGMSKAGLDMLTKVMGLELGPHKVATYSFCDELLKLYIVASDSCECSEPYSSDD